MDPLEKIIGTNKYLTLSDLERSRINELIDANPVYEFLVAGIIGGPEWRRVLGEAYLKYVKPYREAKAAKSAKAIKESPGKQTDDTVIFGAGNLAGLTKSRLAI